MVESAFRGPGNNQEIVFFALVEGNGPVVAKNAENVVVYGQEGIATSAPWEI